MRTRFRPNDPDSSGSILENIEELGIDYLIPIGGDDTLSYAQRLGYMVRCGDPDAMDSIVPMAFGNLALDLIQAGTHGRLVCLRKGVYDSVPIDVV